MVSYYLVLLGEIVMVINPLLVEAVVLSQESANSLVLKHVSETTDMSYELMDLVNTMVETYRKPRQMDVYVKRFDDGRIYIHFSCDIRHPDDTIPMKRDKESFIAKVKEFHLLVPAK